MDFAYSPHREPGGTMHLPSPNHHAYRIEGAHFSSSLQQLRRSLSRSPSKPSRFHLRTGKTDSPGSPISPLALSRAFSPKALNPASPIVPYTESPFGLQAPQTTQKKKFTLRRPDRFRSSPRNRTTTTPKSPRRALVESTDRGNASPFVSRPLFGDGNTPARKNSADFWEQADSMLPDIDDKPIKIDWSQRPGSNAPGANRFGPSQPSPLKRRDGTSGFESTSCATPNPKRRSLHGAVGDFSVFEQTPAPRSGTEDFQRIQDGESGNVFSTPMANMQSPIRRTTSLRRPVSQRNTTNSPRPKPVMDGDFLKPGPAASKTRPQRASMDGFAFSSPAPTDSTLGRSTTSQPSMRGVVGNSQRHPLANTLTASSSSSVVGDSPVNSPAAPTPGPRNMFTKSLPIGAMRPQRQPPQLGEASYGTPLPVRLVEPNHLARSTGGLLSKKSRDVESPKADKYQLPETPSKRHSFPPNLGAESPLDSSFRMSFTDRIQQQQQQPIFGTPSSHASRLSLSSMFGNSDDSFDKRRGSVLSLDGGDDDVSASPSANRMTDSQSSADDAPPTPTKTNDGSGRRSGRSSLRRSTFARPPRQAIEADTFTAPGASEAPNADTAVTYRHSIAVAGPQTPNESTFMPLDASKLTISGQRRGSLQFDSSLDSNRSNSFPPMTPTTPRDHSHSFAHGKSAIPIGLPKNDVDESLALRFGDVQKLEGAKGEFSQMFKVSRPHNQGVGRSTPPGSLYSVVKKSKKPIMGPSDRKRKLQEVNVLMALRGNDHIVAYKNHWEHSHFLYIETEYCDNGNLKDFLTKGRLDDFRIWKILLDLSLGLKFIHDSNFIHLDLKPANILIDFGGWLKIADFGLASVWPAPKNIDGEGDRSYLAPEALQGRFDKPADVFALGIILAEIAGDCQIPEFGEPWQKLRSGEFTSVLPSLSWSTQSTLSRDDHGDPVDSAAQNVVDATGYLTQEFQEEVSKAPSFMTDDQDPWAMDQMVKAMLNPDPNSRPTAEDVCLSHGCQWVAQKRSAGATVYEGNFGPSEEHLYSGEPMITDHSDAMDMS